MQREGVLDGVLHGEKECYVEWTMSGEMSEITFGKGKGGGGGKRKGVKKEDRIFNEVLTSQLEEIMMENDKELAKQYRNPKTTQAEKSNFW